MGRLQRILRHLTTTGAAARRAFPSKTLSAVRSEIATGERQHRAQMKLIIEPGLDWPDLLDDTTSRGRAHELFSRYRVWDTEENCGVLIYINLADRTVEIVTDRVVGRVVPKSDWEASCVLMTDAFRQGRFDDGVLAGVRHVNALLARHFPARGDTERGNEVSDRPVIL